MAPAQAARHTLGLAVLGGLLSSSCCVLQLFLNALSLGCAGFSALTPYRPLFLALTASSLGAAHWRNRNAAQTLVALAVSASLAFTPELVRTYVEGKPPAALARWLPPSRSAGSSQVPLLDKAAQSAWAAVELRADGIRCAGCAARVRHAVLAGVPGVKSCTVEYETGRVTAAGRGVGAAAVAAAVEELGYTVRKALAVPRAEAAAEL